VRNQEGGREAGVKEAASHLDDELLGGSLFFQTVAYSARSQGLPDRGGEKGTKNRILEWGKVPLRKECAGGKSITLRTDSRS